MCLAIHMIYYQLSTNFSTCGAIVGKALGSCVETPIK